MALNQISIVQPHQPGQQYHKPYKDDLDKILQGLQIAQTGLGIGVNYEAIQNHIADTENKDVQTGLLKQQQSGLLSPKERVDLIKEGKVAISPPDAPGGFNVRSANGPGTEDVLNETYAPVMKPPADPKLAQVKTTKNGVNGTMFAPEVAGSFIPGPTELDPLHSFIASQAAAAAEDKKIAKQNESYRTMNDSAEKFRSNPAAAQADKTLQLIRSAKAQLAQAPDGDLNKLSQVQVKSFFADMAAIQKNGGIATEGDKRDLDPGTYSEGFSNLLSKGFNEPTPANLGDFLGKNQTLLNDLEKVAQDKLNRHYENVFVGSRDLVSDKQRAEYLDRYPGLFPKKQVGPPAAASGNAQFKPGKDQGQPPIPKAAATEELRRRGVIK